MSRQPIVTSVLLPRLLAAIGAGTVLAGAGCGGKTNDPSANQVSNAIDGEENTTSDSGGGWTTDVSALPSTATLETGATTSAVMSTPTSSESTTAPDTSTSDASTDEYAGQCEVGNAREFCLNVEDMETRARWGVQAGYVGDPTEPLRSEDEIAAGWDENGCMNHEWVTSGCCNPALAAGEAQGDGTCCYVACEGVCCGRPLVVNGLTLVTPVVSNVDWLLAHSDGRSDDVKCVSFDAATREQLAQAWLDDASMEHASIASFAQFTLDLLRLGAPPELVRDSQLAGLDEVEHARIGYSIASKLAATEYGPGKLGIGHIEVRSLEQAVAAAVSEGCIGETLAAGVVAEQARRCTDPTLKATLAKIAEDELRHSELAWRFVAWAVQRYGGVARSVAEGAFAQALKNVPEAPAELPLPSAVLHSAGRITSGEWRATVNDITRDVIQPAVKNLLTFALPTPRHVANAQV